MPLTTDWNTTKDSNRDATGAGLNDNDIILSKKYEYLGATYIIREDEILIAFSSNIPNTGHPDDEDNQRVGHGVAFLNPNPEKAIGSNNPGLIAIRFGAHHTDPAVDSTLQKPLGAFSDFQLKSVTDENGRHPDLILGGDDTTPGYQKQVEDLGGEVTFGESKNGNATYLGGADNPIINEIAGGTLIEDSGFRDLTPDEIAEASAEFAAAGIDGQYTFGFAVSKDLIPPGEATLSLWAECGNDAIAADIIHFGSPSVSFEKSANGFTADTPAEAAVIGDKQLVNYQFALTNDGDVPLPGSAIDLSDPGTPLAFLPFSDIGGDNVLSVGETWYYASAPQETVSLARIAGFDFDASGNPILPGEFIGDQYADWGLDIFVERHPATDGEEPAPCPEAPEDPNFEETPRMVPPENGNSGQAFNSQEPTGCDEDLRTVDQGNVLISSENDDPRNPDDNAWGATFTFTWDEPVQFGQIGLLDLAKDLQLTARSGEVLVADFTVGGAGAETQQSVDLAGYAPIDSLVVSSDDSFAITQLDWNAFVENTATVMVTEELFTIVESDSAYYIAGATTPPVNRNLELFGSPVPAMGADCLCAPEVVAGAVGAIAF